MSRPGAVGAFCGNDDIAAVAYLIDRANDYGFDAIEIGTVLAMYMEYTQNGYANGDGLGWGDTHGMVEMARKIAFREGVGDILAEGTGKAAKKLGHPEFAMACKGQGIPAYDPRHQGHGHRLCNQRPRRVPLPRLHAGGRGGRQRARSVHRG